MGTSLQEQSPKHFFLEIVKTLLIAERKLLIRLLYEKAVQQIKEFFDNYFRTDWFDYKINTISLSSLKYFNYTISGPYLIVASKIMCAFKRI